MKGNAIEFEISSKIPEDEIKTPKAMESYFDQMKKTLGKGKNKPKSIERENIVWDFKKETEKKRDYVKLLYRYPLDDLFDNKVVAKRHEQVVSGKPAPTTPDSSSAFTTAGRVVLGVVRETIQQRGKDSLIELMEVNKKVKASLKG